MKAALLSLLAYLLSNAAFAASWTASVDQTQGLPVLSRGGATALSGALARRIIAAVMAV